MELNGDLMQLQGDGWPVLSILALTVSDRRRPQLGFELQSLPGETDALLISSSEPVIHRSQQS